MNKIAIGSGVIAAVILGGSALAAGSASGAEFLKKAIEGDNSEIMLGQLAQQKGASAGIRDFGQTLVQDHTQAKQQAEMVAQSMGVTPPTQPMPEASREEKKLQGMSGAAFDREFARYMVQDHRKDIGDFQRQAAKHKGPVSNLARQTLPTLHKHLDMAEKLQRG